MSHPEVLLVKDVLKICSAFTGEHPCRSAISIKLLYAAKLQENTCMGIPHGCSPANFLHIFRTTFTNKTSLNKRIESLYFPEG